VTDSAFNLRAEPWADRLADNPDPSLLFSSRTHGDPNTPLPRAYQGDPLAIRTVNVGPADRHARPVSAQGRPADVDLAAEAEQLRRMRAGAYVLELRAGASAKRLEPATLKATMRFTSRLPHRVR
jgi:hypothetical protein